MRTNNDLWQVLTTIHANISAADQKAAALLTIAGVLIAFPAPSILVPNSNQPVPFSAAVCAALAACAFLVSICAALAVLFPRTTNTTDTSSLIYFGDIAAAPKAAYVEALGRCDETRYRDDLAAQIHINADIASKKYRHFQLAIQALLVGIALLIVAYGALAWSSKGASRTTVPAADAQEKTVTP